MSSSRLTARSAFAIVDLLTVLAVLALAATVLLPAFAASRNASQGALSRSNLKLLIRAQSAYSLSNQGKWPNPFNPAPAFWQLWNEINVPGQPGLVWRFDDPGFQTETYSICWASGGGVSAFLGGNPLAQHQFDPRDTGFSSQLQQWSTQFDLSQLMWPGSYLYSPTMWFHPARYAETARFLPGPPNQFNGTRSVRYNTTAETTYPSLKVVLFQRADFDQTVRPGPDGQLVSLPPQWNNSIASPDAAFADGSVDEVSIRKVQASIAAGASWLSPTTPSWNLPSQLLEGFGAGTGWENGQGGTGAWPAYFWGTRYGINGRDVLRR